MCRFKTPACVRSGRLRVYRQRARMSKTCHSSSSSSASSSSPTVSEIQIREQEDGINSDTSPVQVSTSVDDRSEQPDETHASKIPKTPKTSHRQIGVTVVFRNPGVAARIQGEFGGS